MAEPDHTMTTNVPRRVLIIRPSALGDVCRSVGVLAALRRAWPAPQTEIDWLVQDSFADAVRHHPGLTRAVPFARKRMASWWWRPRAMGELGKLLSELRRARYDVVLDCQGLARSGVFARATGAKRRIGYADAQEWSHLALTERVEAPLTLHTVDRMMRLARAAVAGAGNTGGTPVPRESEAPDLRLYSGEGEREWLSRQEWSRRSYVVLAPASRWPGKRWSPGGFAVVAKRLLDGDADGVVSRRAEAIVVVGGASERAECLPTLVADGAHSDRIIDLIGKTTVGQLMAVIQRAALVIANDSAALHMAVGFERPLVALYGPTRIDRVGPYGREADVIQHLRAGEAESLDHKDEASGRAMMERISAEEVLSAAALRLSAPGPRMTEAARP